MKTVHPEAPAVVRVEPEATVLVEATRRKHWLSTHGTWFAIGVSVCAGLSLLISTFGGEGNWPWAIVLIWAGLLGAHGFRYWSWKQANEELLARVIAKEGEKCDPILIELEVRPASPTWIRLWDEACTRFLAADHALARLGTGGLIARGDIQASMGQVKLLVQGQARLETAMRSLVSGELDDKVTEAKWSLERCEDDRLRKIYASNLELLEKQRGTVHTLERDVKRIQATVEGFALAAHNIHLNASRLGASGENPGSLLAESLVALDEEVRVLRQVEAELEGL